MTNNYNSVAGIYDVSSRMVFGKAQQKSQTGLLNWIPPQSRILIVGGGTGWILESITAIYPSGLDILYVEASAKMMALSRKRNFGNNAVTFICNPIESCNFNGLFDIVFTAYLFDNFLRTEAEVIFQILHQMLRPGGRWLFADFYIDAVHPPLWQKLLWYTMFSFFRITCGVQAKKLVDMSGYFKKAEYRLLQEKEYYSGFITGKVYEKIILQ
ncbi:MAG: class I SAM-dependent methyltransferase [Bacteroidetes bacterium]|nr:class I SAM-dependent methyltransferase [Bacteroidota bacterium]